ncbi:hypothetical protein STBHUCCB_46190 [Salmonella enterica subsp. enterica serovar Typhi str. P-stx-12]|nr:hypothetical protein STBHUCCB_46190 [Salmonella enterica subsp. enterica serovar Typhi str. P-stx-12]AXR58907.1 hypothetical protein CJP42_0725 [Salmonella enterica subsp. enterica serovar Typhi]
MFITTTGEANLMVVEPDGVSLTGLIDTGALCSAPARPTIEM